MEIERFNTLVARLEAESTAAPGRYRAKVAALTLMGFCIMALLFGAVGFGLVLLAGIALAMAFSGGAALILLLKLGKLLFLLAIPLWYLIKSGVQALFIRLPAPQGRELSQADAPQLFAALARMRQQMNGPRFHHVLVVDEVNAAVVQRPAFGLVGWPRNYLLLGLPLLESMPAEEALAVVAHEYGHLAGSHGRFSAYIYRLRHTWGTVQAYTDQVQGWLGKLVGPLVRWYAPWFNAYTFVLARSDEYAADAASAQLVGVGHAAHALKRVNVVAPYHQRFMNRTFDRIVSDAQPPADLMRRWAFEAGQPVPLPDAQRWLDQALDREGHFTDTHPTLRARLSALSALGESVQEPPPALQGPSAAQAWLGPMADTLRAEFEARWAAQVAEPWAERHAQALQQRERLTALQTQAERSAEEDIERFKLLMSLEPEQDLRELLADFNARHPDHVHGLYLEGVECLLRGDERGLAVLDRACALDPEALKPASERAHAYLMERGRKAEAEVHAERWRTRDALDTLRKHQLETLTPKDRFSPHGMPRDEVVALRALLNGPALQHVGEVYLARRDIPAAPDTVQWVMGVRLSWWGRRRGKQTEVINRLAALEWPQPLLFVSLDGRFATWRKALKALPGARLI